MTRRRRHVRRNPVISTGALVVVALAAAGVLYIVTRPKAAPAPISPPATTGQSLVPTTPPTTPSLEPPTAPHEPTFAERLAEIMFGGPTTAMAGLPSSRYVRTA